MFQVHTKSMSKILPLVIIALLVITLIPTHVEAASYSSQPKAVITFSSDDGYIGVYQNKDVFINRSIPLTMFIITGVVGDSDRMNWTQLHELNEEGWEIGSHTAGAADLTTYNSSNLYAQVVGSKHTLESQGFDVNSIAYPNGVTNNTVTNLIKQHYSCARDVTTAGYVAVGDGDATITVSDFDGLAPTDNLPQMKSWIDAAIANNDWLNIYFHNITADGKFTSINSYYVSDLLDYVKAKVDAGLIRALNFYDGYRAFMDRTQEIRTRTMAINSQTSFFDCSEDAFYNPTLRFTGLTLTNLLVNPSFEEFTTSFPGWNNGAGCLSKTRVSGGYLGTYAGDWKYNAASSSWARSIYQDVLVSPSTIVPGDYVFAYAYIKNIANVTKIGMTLEYYNAAGTMISQTIESNQAITTSWAVYDNRLLTAWSKIPTDCTKVRWRIDVNEFSVGAADGTIRVDGAVLTKITIDPLPVTFDKPPYILRPTAPFVGVMNTSNMSIVMDGATYTHAGSLGDNEYVDFVLPDGMFVGLHQFLPTIGGHGLAYIELVGNRSASISHGKFGTSPADTYRIADYTNASRLRIWERNESITIDSPVSINADVVIDDGTYYILNSAGYEGPYKSVSELMPCVLQDGVNTILTRSEYMGIKMDAAISPFFVIIPLVIILSVIPMVMGLGRKLK